MTVWLITFVARAAFFVFMSVGVFLGRKPIQGSCGGLNAISGMDKCELCGGSPQKCDEISAQSAPSAQVVDAMATSNDTAPRAETE